jgi:hypothetical protein
MATLVHPEGIPNIIVVGLPNIAALRRAETKLRSNGIPHYAWSEPDYDFGFTAIATAPLHGEQRKVLANYRVYNTGIAQLVERRGSNPEGAGSSPAPCANGAGTDASAVRV